MKEIDELAEIPLAPYALARKIGVSQSRLFRAANLLNPPVEMEGKRILPHEYPRIYEMIINEDIYLMHKALSCDEKK